MLAPMTTSSPDPDRPPLDILVLGGTSWLGGAIARVAVARSHRVTCLARGEAGSPPDGVTWVRADRSEPTAYAPVAEEDWDAVVDVSWQPDFVRSALASLADRARHWVYVSSCSVYSDDSIPDTDESAAVHEPWQGSGRVDGEQYGQAKVACEQACLAAMGDDHVLLARAGLIAGYGDRSDRFGYWPARAAQAADGEAVLVPPLKSAQQVIDVEDLAQWLVLGCEEQVAGVFNALGDVYSLSDVVEASAAAAGTRPNYVEASDDWLAAHEVEPWMGAESLPLWLPQSDYLGFMTRRNDAATAAGMRLRPLAETVASSLRWEREQGLDRERRAGLTASRESALLGALGEPGGHGDSSPQ